MDDDATPAIVPERDDAVALFSAHVPEPVYTVALSSTGVGASGGGDDKAYLWNPNPNPNTTTPVETSSSALVQPCMIQAAATLAGHEDSVSCLGFSADGTILATGGMEGRVLLWNVEDGSRRHVCEGPGDAIEWLTWHSRGRIVLAGSADYRYDTAFLARGSEGGRWRTGGRFC